MGKEAEKDEDKDVTSLDDPLAFMMMKRSKETSIGFDALLKSNEHM